MGHENTADIVKDYDAVLECSGSSRTRYLVNDACVIENKPLFIAEMAGDWGRAMSVYPGEGPCYRCVFPKPDFDQNGREGNGYSHKLEGLMGLIQASEIFKFFLAKGDPLKNELLLWNGSTMRFQRNPVERKSECPLCGENRAITRLMGDEGPYEAAV